jgi:ribosome-associated protein
MAVPRKPLMLIVTNQLQVPLREFTFTFSRSSGPGGQNVNKVNSKATLRWNAAGSPSLPDDVRARFFERFGRRLTEQGDMLVVSQRYRDQARNVDDCLEKLRAMLAEIAYPPRRRKPSRPTQASRRRRLQDKRATSDRKASRRRPATE